MDNSRKAIAAITVVVLVFALISLASFAGSTAWRTGGPGWGMGPGMMGRMLGPGALSQPPAAPAPAANDSSAWPSASWALVLVVTAAVILLAWLAITRNHRAPRQIKRRQTPLEIAKRRYVTGEITLPEYEEIMRVLTEAGEALETIDRPTKD